MRNGAIAATICCLAAAGALALPALAATRTVTVRDNAFAPTATTVAKGTTVRWVWKGKSPHNVWVTRGPAKFSSPIKTKGSFARKLTKPGTYSIVCTIHQGMKMTIRVR